MKTVTENYQRIADATDEQRAFDIRFWQSQGSSAIFEAAADMLHDYLLIRGKDADQLRETEQPTEETL